eukprot:CAMPEP_0183735082 /NCGR_PEP_ID=MMETSP0737-20130205/45618_1 /TAXON_ID=385413 /ORGANISM="Thalassiosira miniscula, Strain CCMP1093" /LENGTH=288 /DNA_ID=CAMNT_0025968733 /DNA_START=41 /DNA_END=904 /DNA_ORIENTATION=+
MTKKWRRDYGEGHNIDETDIDASEDADVIASTTRSDLSGNELNRSSPSDNNFEAKSVIKETASSSWPVALYVPNLLGYLRIILSFWGLNCAQQQRSNNALNIWIIASLLDLFDGLAARKLNQCSQFGVVLDIMADNILRTIIWIASMIEISKSEENNGMCIVWATIIICLEWITMFCSQQKSQPNQKEDQEVHWKDVKRKAAESDTSKRPPPFFVQAVFKNNFRTIPGIFAIYGLFVAPFGTYVWYADLLDKADINMSLLRFLSRETASILIQISYAGRFLSAMVELW